MEIHRPTMKMPAAPAVSRGVFHAAKFPETVEESGAPLAAGRMEFHDSHDFSNR
ncbi:hypothetical protein SFOMI_1350 [Sphingobium fuliginis]|jgi:hypothetical protein|uniref:Uncharacterized protein n=1 Tax=Sphingobium fuliginis (strain ATCC 27551) TaxID=336203 RepID=A0A292ZD61_SPHSA|nr:hypothetical protein SFOMI_1350 [Sphingobium fuliginis]